VRGQAPSPAEGWPTTPTPQQTTTPAISARSDNASLSGPCESHNWRSNSRRSIDDWEPRTCCPQRSLATTHHQPASDCRGVRGRPRRRLPKDQDPACDHLHGWGETPGRPSQCHPAGQSATCTGSGAVKRIHIRSSGLSPHYRGPIRGRHRCPTAFLVVAPSTPRGLGEATRVRQRGCAVRRKGAHSLGSSFEDGERRPRCGFVR
jgi:hypothetical protein